LFPQQKLIRTAAIVIVAIGFGTCPGCRKANDGRGRSDDTDKFVLLTRIFDAGGDKSAAEEFEGTYPWDVEVETKGSISWISRERGKRQFFLIIENITRRVESKEVEQLIIPIKPFKARVEVEESAPVQLRIEMAEEAAKDDAVSLGAQYRTAYLIIEMMFANALDDKIRLAEDSNCPLRFETRVPDKVQIADGVVKPAAYLRNAVAPAEFVASPQIGLKGMKGYHLQSMTYDTMHIKYFYRLVDIESRLASHAVNIEANWNERVDRQKVLAAVERIDDPYQFGTYYMNELRFDVGGR